jgi:hypothetical protein
MSGGVFICYRREESAFAARAIYDRVAQKVGRENVFLDVDNIELGVDWFDALNERVAACDALIAVIGRNWVAADKDNRRRIDDPDDFVRIEIEAALKRGVRGIPVLVDGALMPKTSDLPESLRGFARRQNIEISHSRFETDVERLTRALTSILEPPRPRQVDKPKARCRRTESQRGQIRLSRRIHRQRPRKRVATGPLPTGEMQTDKSTLVGYTRMGAAACQRTTARRRASISLPPTTETRRARTIWGPFMHERAAAYPRTTARRCAFTSSQPTRETLRARPISGSCMRKGAAACQRTTARAARLYKLAADQGNAGSQANLGIFYEKAADCQRTSARRRASTSSPPIRETRQGRSISGSFVKMAAAASSRMSARP